MGVSKLLIIDDSALVRRILKEIFDRDPSIEVVGTARDPFDARTKIKQLKPDVLTLDVEMPRMDGLTFLSNLMRLRPMPVVMISSLTERGADVTLRALELGAIDFVSKPKSDISETFGGYADEIIKKVKMAARARVRPHRSPSSQQPDIPPRLSVDAVIDARPTTGHFNTTEKIVAIGASTGGTEAIRHVLEKLPHDFPGVVMTQHIPGAFSRPFSERLNTFSQLTVVQAEEGQRILPGHAYLAPGEQHLLVGRNGAHYICHLSDGPPVNRHRPSVDVLFRSVAQHVGSNAVGVILTGMGADGALGMKEMHEAGARTIAQDEATSVVWGMPGEAVKAGGVDKVVALQHVGSKLLAFVKDATRAAS